MAEKDKENQKKPPSEESKETPDDFEKTVLDIKVKDIDRVLDETMIFKRPQLEEEDTDLHRLRKLKETEQAQKEAAQKAAREKGGAPGGEEALPSKEGIEGEPSVSPQTSEVKEGRPQEAREKRERPKEEEAPVPQPSAPPSTLVDKLWKGLEFAVGLVLLLLLLDASVEGLFAGSPFSKFTIAATAASVLIGVAFIVKKGNFHVGVEAAAAIVLVLFAYGALKYGSADPKVLSVLKHPPADLYNLVFLSLYALAALVLLFRTRVSHVVKMVLGGLIFYASAGILENLIRGLSFPRPWNLEDSLFGSPLWGWMPIPYLRPTLFGFWALLPALVIFFLISRQPAREGEQKSFLGSARNGFAAFLLLLALGLAHVLMFNQRLPSLVGFFKKASLGVGEAKILKLQDKVEDYDVKIATANASTEKTNDLAHDYGMAAAFQPDGEGKKNLLLTVRGEGGRAVPFLTAQDLSLLQDGAPQKPLRLRFKEDELLAARSVAVFVDRSSVMGSSLPSVDGAVRDLFDLTQSKERFLLVSFADDSRSSWVKGKEDLKKLLSGIFSQGGRNLAGGLSTGLQSFKGSGEAKLILLVTAPDAALAPDAEAKISAQLKSLKARLYVFSMGEATPLKSLAESSGGRSIAVPKPLTLGAALRGAFAQSFGEYQISYEGQSLAPRFELSGLSPDAVVSKDTPLTLKILNPAEAKVKSARLYVDGKVTEEAPVQGQAEVKFLLSPSKLPSGSHMFKPTLVAEDGKEYGQEIRLSVAAGFEFRFIRPLDGDVVSGPVNLEVFLKSSGMAVTRVDFLVDGQKVGEAGAEPYLFTWDASTQTGIHSLQAVGVFSDGSTKTDQVKVNVMPGFSVKMLSPSVGEFLSSSEVLEADVAHPLSEIITKVEFFADGVSVGEVNQPPYKYSWDNSDIGGGKHVIQARATSSSNLTATDAVTVNIGSGSLSVSLAGGAAGAPAGGAYLTPDTLEFVVDSSSSMNRPLGSGRKIDFVKQVLFDMLPKVPSNTQVALRFFGSESSAVLKDCGDSVLAFPPKPADSGRIGSLLSRLEAKGLTPLSYVLERVRADLKGSLGSRVVVLITDGYEDCGGDPVGQLEKWKKEKFSAKLYVIGLDLEGSRAETELKRLTAFMGGQFFPVKNEKDALSALEEMVKVTYRVLDYKGREVLQKPVGAGSAPLRTGEYRVEVDLDPPLVKEKVVIQQGTDKKLILKKNGVAFSLEDQ